MQLYPIDRAEIAAQSVLVLGTSLLYVRGWLCLRNTGKPGGTPDQGQARLAKGTAIEEQTKVQEGLQDDGQILADGIETPLEYFYGECSTCLSAKRRKMMTHPDREGFA